MADKLYLQAGFRTPYDGCAEVVLKLCKVDLLGGPWVVNVDPATGQGFNVSHAPTGLATPWAHRLLAHQSRAVADALNKHARFYTVTKCHQQRHFIEAICAATLEGEQV